ncbi:hypothetical protein CSA37_11820 [Candidatus Fermentibacteria bacterium]|nr:MAG: hypothetical protein CSA37_11820 [Candidatus Fermentibacteria bacterium]
MVQYRLTVLISVLLLSCCSGTRIHTDTGTYNDNQPNASGSGIMSDINSRSIELFRGSSGDQVIRQIPLHAPHLSDLPYSPESCPAESGMICLLQAILRSEGLPVDLAALPWVESSYYIGDYSRVGAAGPWQFMSGTARHFHMNMTEEVDERYSWTSSTRTASDYLSYLRNYFGDWHLALAAYNCGEGVVQRALADAERKEYGMIELPGETDVFVPRFSAALDALRGREQDNPELSVVLVPPGLDLRILAAESGIDPGLLADWNRSFLKERTPAGGRNWELVVPSSRAAVVFQAAWTVNRTDYLVRAGDTWASISSALGISEGALKEANNSVLPAPGQFLLLPESDRMPVNTQAAQRAGFYAYTVRSGDTLGGIGASIGVSSREVAAWNDISTTTMIYPGQRLMLRGTPLEGSESVQIISGGSDGEVTHVVRHGDTMWQLAVTYGVSVEQIQELNGKENSSLSIGEILIIKPE